MGSLAQISSGKIRCGFNTRFRARFRRVLEGSGAAVLEGSRCRYLVRFRRVLVRFRTIPVQIPGEVLPDGSGADSWWSSGWLRADSRWGSGGFAKVPESSGAGTWWGFGRFRRRYVVRLRLQRVLVQIPSDVLEDFGADTCWGSGVPVQIPGEVLEGSGADTCWGSGGFQVQIPGEVLEGFGADTWWDFRYLVQILGKVPERGTSTWWGSGGFRCT